ncbi:MAG: hypothetical protein MHMPM18_004785, partial [Marteilia pararefringens]
MVLLIADMSESPRIKYSFFGITIGIFIGESILYVLIMKGAYTDNEVIVDNDLHENLRSESHPNHNSYSRDNESRSIGDDPPRFDEIFAIAGSTQNFSTPNFESVTRNANQTSREIYELQELDTSAALPTYDDIFPDGASIQDSSTQNTNQTSRVFNEFQESHLNGDPTGYFVIYPEAAPNFESTPPRENQ